MLSDVTISFADHTLTFPGLYLLIGCLVIVGLAGFIVAMNSTRRIERKTSEATDILVVQLSASATRSTASSATMPLASSTSRRAALNARH